MEEGDGDPAQAGRAGQRRGQGALPDRGRQHRQLRAALHGRSGGPVQPGPRRGPRGSEGLRADRQDHDYEEGLEEPGAQLPQDDQAARHGAGARQEADGRRAVARAGRDLPVAPQGLQVRDRRLRGLPADGSRRDGASPDPRRAVPAVGPGDLRAGDQVVPPADQGDDRLRSDGRLPQDAAQAADGAAPVRQGLVRGGRGVVPAQGRRRGDAVLRAVQAQGASRAPARG